MNKTIFVLLAAALALASCNSKPGAQGAPADSSQVAGVDTSLVLEPTPEQIAKATRVGNKHCPTDGMKLGSMGAAASVIYKGQVVDLCCQGCAGEFATDPGKYLAIAKADTASE